LFETTDRYTKGNAKKNRQSRNKNNKNYENDKSKSKTFFPSIRRKIHKKKDLLGKLKKYNKIFVI